MVERLFFSLNVLGRLVLPTLVFVNVRILVLLGPQNVHKLVKFRNARTLSPPLPAQGTLSVPLEAITRLP